MFMCGKLLFTLTSWALFAFNRQDPQTRTETVDLVPFLKDKSSSKSFGHDCNDWAEHFSWHAQHLETFSKFNFSLVDPKLRTWIGRIDSVDRGVA